MVCPQTTRLSGSMDLSASAQSCGGVPLLLGLATPSANRRVSMNDALLQVYKSEAIRGSASPCSMTRLGPSFTFSANSPTSATRMVHPSPAPGVRVRASTGGSSSPRNVSRQAGANVSPVPLHAVDPVKMSKSLANSAAAPGPAGASCKLGLSLASTASTTAPPSPMGPGVLPVTPARDAKTTTDSTNSDVMLHTPPKGSCIWKPPQQAAAAAVAGYLPSADSWVPCTPRATARIMSPQMAQSHLAPVLPRTPSAPSVGQVVRVPTGGFIAPHTSPQMFGRVATVSGHSGMVTAYNAAGPPMSFFQMDVPASWEAPSKDGSGASPPKTATSIAAELEELAKEVPPPATEPDVAPAERAEKGPTVLNVPRFPGGFRAKLPTVGSIDAVQLSADLQSCILTLYMEHLQEGGKKVDYEALRSAEDFESYVAKTSELAGADLRSLTQEQLKVFVLNIYNALVIHAMAVLGGFDINVKGSIAEFFSSASYLIGGHVFTLDDLEHGVLRGNQPHPTSGKVAFKDEDPRLELALPLDPRIHCALVCGAKSCPPIRIYEEDNLEEGLDLAVAAFCDSEVKASDKGVITMSKIFQWYSADFAATETEMLEYLVNYMEGPDAADLRVEMSRGPRSDSNPDGFVIEYSPYDWSRNGLA